MRRRWVVVLVVMAILVSSCSSGIRVIPTESEELIPESIELSVSEYEEVSLYGTFGGILTDLYDMISDATVLESEWNDDLYLEFKVRKANLFLLAAEFSNILPPPEYKEVHKAMEAWVEASIELAELLDECVENEDISVFEAREEMEVVGSLGEEVLKRYKDSSQF